MDIAIDERVQAIVHARREQLEEIVRAALDRELQVLVDQELERRVNGATGITYSKDVVPEKVCRGPCGRTLPASSFDKHRRVCRDCRKTQARGREHRAEASDGDDGPRLAGTSQPG